MPGERPRSLLTGALVVALAAAPAVVRAGANSKSDNSSDSKGSNDSTLPGWDRQLTATVAFE